MVIALLGASCSGKSTIENELIQYYGFKKIIPFTTRKPRLNEINSKDYYFTTNDFFESLINTEQLAEYDKYSQDRLYGTLKTDYEGDDNKIVVLTPNGLRRLKKNIPNSEIFSVFINAKLGTRIKRYIDRCGIDNFDFDNKNEICGRVERDYAMFLGIEYEVDSIVDNDSNDLNDVMYRIKKIIDKVV